MIYKKLTYVVYYRDDQYKIIKTLESILNQNTHQTDYDVIIFDDYSKDDGAKKIKKFIKENNLINFNLIQFDEHLGISNIFSFINKANLIKSKYVTFLKAGDEFGPGWANNFINNLYPKDIDMYLHNFEEHIEITKSKKSSHGDVPIIKEYIKKVKYYPFIAPEGEVDRKYVISTLHLFFSKVFNYSKVRSMKVFEDRILYQDLYIYQKMISMCSTFYYSHFDAGIMSHKPWIEPKMDKERIVLLCKTIDKMISNNNVILNGLLLQVLTIAIKHSSKLDYGYYIISKFKHLKSNFKIRKIRGVPISRLSILKSTRRLVSTGKLVTIKKK